MKFGINQIGKEAPEWLVKLIDILIMFIMPAFVAFILSIPDKYLSMDFKNLLGAGATFVIAILKGIQYMSGKKDNQQP